MLTAFGQSRRQAAAPAGLCPYNRDSGLPMDRQTLHQRWRGRNLRRASLYMAALSASRNNHLLKPGFMTA